jgi:hypothetical protein
MNIKIIIKNNFKYFSYFYSFLRYRVFVTFGLSFTKAVLDGFGLAMFIPLLKMSTDGSSSESSDDLGNLSFLPRFLEIIGIDLNYSFLFYSKGNNRIY